MATGIGVADRPNVRSTRDESTINGAVNSFIISTLARTTGMNSPTMRVMSGDTVLMPGVTPGTRPRPTPLRAGSEDHMHLSRHESLLSNLGSRLMPPNQPRAVALACSPRRVSFA